MAIVWVTGQHLLVFEVLLSLFTLYILGATVKENDNITYVQAGDMHNPMECYQEINSKGGQMHSHHSAAGYGGYFDNTDCKVTITTDLDKRIHLRFTSFDLKSSTNCVDDALLIYDGKDVYDKILRSSCGSEVPTEVMSTTNVVSVRFITAKGSNSNKQGFSIIYSTVVPEEMQEDAGSCFPCLESSLCIDNSLKCDGLRNCVDNSDELFSLCSETPVAAVDTDYGSLTTMGTVFGIIVAFSIVFIIIFVVVIYCCCRYRCMNRTRSSSRNHIIHSTFSPHSKELKNGCGLAAAGAGGVTAVNKVPPPGMTYIYPSTRCGTGHKLGYISSEDGTHSHHTCQTQMHHHIVSIPAELAKG